MAEQQPAGSLLRDGAAAADVEGLDEGTVLADLEKSNGKLESVINLCRIMNASINIMYQ